MAASDITSKVKTTTKAIPTIYAYTTPGVTYHDGWTKIGYTEQDVETRIKQQTHTADVSWKKEWQGNAIYEDGSGDTFTDHDFHGYLEKNGIERQMPAEGSKKRPEWFRVTGPDSRNFFFDFRVNRGSVGATETVPYNLRNEQEQAVEVTVDYAKLHESGEFLWNAKPRFGKTLTAYDLCLKLDAVKALIVTNRPAIANSWYDDYVKFVGLDAGYHFISSTSALAGKPFVKTREEYLQYLRTNHEGPKKFIEFVSLQDLKGAIKFGGKFDKLNEVADIDWDILIIDEAHEGVDTYKTDVAFDHIKRKFTLHLSGTPFKAIANDKFASNAIFNWTYADEQQAKRDWNDADLENPYATLPRLNMFTYQMSDIVTDTVAAGMEIDGEDVEYAFDLNEFFATTERGNFIHNDDVDRFLEALTTQKKFPFSTPELREELKHTFWMLNRVDSAKALKKKLDKHPLFKDYEIVLAAGDGRVDEDEAVEKSLDKVRKAIIDYDKTITLSVGQLTTGVTIPEWTAVLMLSNMKSPSLYMQAAFRAQNPCLFRNGAEYLRKENAYVFDFDPARTLTIFEQFANDLYSETSGGKGGLDERKQRIRRLLNFFPVIGEDEDGEMIELDAEKVLSIPRKIRSAEVVRRGFMSDFLFQNISNVFRAPAQVIEIIQNFEPYKAPNEDMGVHRDTADELNLNDEGEVEIPQEQVVGTAADLFGDKVYEDLADELDIAIEEVGKKAAAQDDPDDKLLSTLQDAFVTTVVTPLVVSAGEKYADELSPLLTKKVERTVKADADAELNKQFGDYKITRNVIEHERKTALEKAETDAAMEDVDAAYDEKIKQVTHDLIEGLKRSKTDLVKTAGENVVRVVETDKKEKQKQTIEGSIRDHLRGFSRTIPSFLMAYGDEETKLSVFDTTIPEQVFYEVTSISTDEFRLLRDGGEVENPETGEMEYFAGNVFDPVVFDDSVAEFIRLRGALANYFDEGQKEDIFDYVPPQKTNQIYTPKRVVKQMVDLFEQENPGCFNDPEHTFADLYMKSGLYITEIIKRLYNSDGMKAAFPDEDARLKYILENQVFGIAPTEIIYQIATHFILGYDNGNGDSYDTNFVMADSAALAKEGKLAAFVEETFGSKLSEGYDETSSAAAVQEVERVESTPSLGDSLAKASNDIVPVPDSVAPKDAPADSSGAADM